MTVVQITILKIKALQQVAARFGLGVVVRDRYEAVTFTLCKKKNGAAFHSYHASIGNVENVGSIALCVISSRWLKKPLMRLSYIQSGNW
ncbi:hypothetical protein DPMN_086277 [Dreissena polymorpha]|uniref:Uncharacterized protein n=1 Tax=Dreissena polymorpha TaxID=45954 RepID=A0A9D4KQK4_DREPO|nr:hypothetical protein DPMN_086277 [Dreissena polymorpha]